MRRVLFAVAISLSSLAMLGCPYVPTNASRMQESAADFNTNVRFGRNELAVEQVLPESREEYLRHHKPWGKELSLCIKYNWYNVRDNDLHVTTVKQKWRKLHGNWKLASEARTEGDVGIFGEEGPTRVAGDPQAPRSVQFPTVRFGD
jgi:hypothetical protein